LIILYNITSCFPSASGLDLDGNRPPGAFLVGEASPNPRLKHKK